MVTKLFDHIVTDTDILDGQPVIEGTAIPVSRLIAEAAEGKPLEAIARDAGVTLDDVRAALNFAAQRASAPVTAEGMAVAPSEPDAVADEARRLGLDPATLSPLVHRLLTLRLLGAADREPSITSWDELEAEVAARRGGDYDEAPDSAQ